MKIFAAMIDDIAKGHVWIDNSNLPIRSVIKVTNVESGHTVYCEALQIDKYFLNLYNKSPRVKIDKPEASIVMSQWYRNRLGQLKTQNNYSLKIEKAMPLWGELRSAMHHPQIIVRVAVYLGIISVSLGVFGIFF